MMLMPKLPLRMGGGKLKASYSVFEGGATSVFSIDVPYPANASPGDLIIMIAGTSSGSLRPFPPTGWTGLVDSGAGVAPSTRIMYQEYPPEMPATQLISTGGSAVGGFGCVMLCIKKAVFDAVGAFRITDAGGPIGPTAAEGKAFAVYRSSASTATFPTPAGWDPLVSRVSGTYGFGIFSKSVEAGPVGQHNSPPSSGTGIGVIFTIKKAP